MIHHGNQPERNIRAVYTEKSIRVYQAYPKAIADLAVSHNRFISPPFKTMRTTWIKPSFLWMMYRSGWAEKVNQERILAIDIRSDGFLWALQHSCLSHFDSGVYKNENEWKELKRDAPVIVQWDPDRDVNLDRLTYKTIQIGLKPEAVSLYNDEWILKISDLTPLTKQIKSLVDNNNREEAQRLLPLEKQYMLPRNIQRKIGIR